MVSDTPKFIDFIGIDRFDSIVSSYYINHPYNCMKTKEKEIQVDLFIPLMSCKYGKKIKGLKHSKYLFQVQGSDVGHNLQFNFCNYLILVFLCKKHYFRFR